MTSGLPRRPVLKSLSWVGLAGFTGCMAPAYRSLQFKRVDPPTESNAELLIDAEVVGTRRHVRREVATFRDVTVVGYTATKAIVGQSEIGTLTPRDTSDITLTCSARPNYLTFTIEKTECDIDTNIGVLRVEPPAEESSYTTLDNKHCDDPELPVPE